MLLRFYDFLRIFFKDIAMQRAYFAREEDCGKELHNLQFEIVKFIHFSTSFSSEV